jgi:hypothetical protein
MISPTELYAKYPSPSIAREAVVVREILSGNVPSFTFTPLTPDILVMSDYASFGSDDNFCRCPLTPYAAQYIAAAKGWKLPTPRLVDMIYAAATAKCNPITESWNYVAPLSGTLSYRFLEHSSLIDERISRGQVRAWKAGDLIAGHKKDVVSTPLLAQHPHHVAIYGWQVDEHHVIQPLTTVHDWNYSDYSHGIRFVQCDDATLAGPCSLDVAPAEFLALVKG